MSNPNPEHPGALVARVACQSKSIADDTAPPIPDCLDAHLTREATAAALTSAGYSIKAKTLATKATRGGGPPYRTWGSRVLYRWGDALAWAEKRLSTPRLSTSESDASRGL
jgi:hypothetical protein